MPFRRLSFAMVFLVLSAANCVGHVPSQANLSRLIGVFGLAFGQGGTTSGPEQALAAAGAPDLQFGYQVNSEIFATFAPFFLRDGSNPSLRRISDFEPVRLKTDEGETYHQFILDGLAGKIWISDGKGSLHVVVDPELRGAVHMAVSNDGAVLVGSSTKLCFSQFDSESLSAQECIDQSVRSLSALPDGRFKVATGSDRIFLADTTSGSMELTLIPINTLLSGVSFVGGDVAETLVIDHGGHRITVASPTTGAINNQAESVSYEFEKGVASEIDMTAIARIPSGFLILSSQYNVVLFVDSTSLKPVLGYMLGQVPIPFRLPSYATTLKVFSGAVHIVDPLNVTVLYDPVTLDLARWEANVPTTLVPVLDSVDFDEIETALAQNRSQDLLEIPSIKSALLLAKESLELQH